MWRELFTRAMALSQSASKQLAPHMFAANLLPRRLFGDQLLKIKEINHDNLTTQFNEDLRLHQRLDVLAAQNLWRVGMAAQAGGHAARRPARSYRGAVRDAKRA